MIFGRVWKKSVKQRELESKEALTGFEDLIGSSSSLLLLRSNRRWRVLVVDPAVSFWNWWRSSHWECPLKLKLRWRRRRRSTPTQHHSEFLSFIAFWKFIHGSCRLLAAGLIANPGIPTHHGSSRERKKRGWGQLEPRER